MKMRGKTTVDFRGSTGRCEGMAPSRFAAGISLTFGLSLSPQAILYEAGQKRALNWHQR
jgi:hypothetical protein